MELEFVKRILIYVVSFYTATMGVLLLVYLLIMDDNTQVVACTVFESFYYMYEFTWNLDSLGLYSLWVNVSLNSLKENLDSLLATLVVVPSVACTVSDNE